MRVPAHLTALSSSSASVRTADGLHVFDNLRVRLPAASGDLTDVFAKVMSEDRGGTFSVRFTSLPPEAREWIDGILQAGASPPDGSLQPPTH